MSNTILAGTAGTHVDTAHHSDTNDIDDIDDIGDNILLELCDTIAMQQSYEVMKLQQWQELLSWYHEGA